MYIELERTLSQYSSEQMEPNLRRCCHLDECSELAAGPQSKQVSLIVSYGPFLQFVIIPTDIILIVPPMPRLLASTGTTLKNTFEASNLWLKRAGWTHQTRPPAVARHRSPSSNRHNCCRCILLKRIIAFIDRRQLALFTFAITPYPIYYPVIASLWVFCSWRRVPAINYPAFVLPTLVHFVCSLPHFFWSQISLPLIHVCMLSSK
jgi:hypothetical protein